MKKNILLALFLGLGIVGIAQSERTIDPAGSKLIWTGKKVTGEHTGGINVQSGTIGWSKDGLTSANVTIDMNSITCTDLEGGGATKLIGHLKSPDFFNTAAHGTATFKSTKVEPIAGAAPGQPNYKVTGDLTIKGVTHPITFDALAWHDGKVVRAAANLVFDRTKYDVRYGSSNFFEGLGDKAISDEVALTFDVTAK
jgi:polyisoprenoid-binding protein YceI